MRRILLLAVLAVACRDSAGPASGPLKIGIVSGDNQTAPAPTAQLPAPVIGQLVRQSDGSVAWRQRAADALLPANAWAQGRALKGAPVAGAVVCAASVGSGLSALTPVVPCTQTDKDGNASFAFKHGTLAGTVKAVVQGMERNAVATYDSVTAIISPGPVEPDMRPEALGWVVSPAKYPMNWIHDKYGNPIPYRIPSDGRLTVADTVVGSSGARTVSFTAAVADGVFRIIGILGVEGTVIANLRYRVFLNAGVPQIDWAACGLAVAVCTGQ